MPLQLLTLPLSRTVRRLGALAAVAGLAACGGKSETAASTTDSAAATPAPNAADSASSGVVTKSAPPTAQDRSVAGRDGATAPGDTNHSGMPVTDSQVPKKSP